MSRSSRGSAKNADDDNESLFELADLKQPLPTWLQEPLFSLLDRADAGRLPHAILLRGPIGVGKRLLAVHLAALLLCENARQRKADNVTVARAESLVLCGTCASCQQIGSANHPDYRCLRPALDSKTGMPRKTIGVDEVRDLTEWLWLTSHYQGYKVAIVDTADLLTPSAANGFLKTLEEPAKNSLLLLLASKPMALPATITSRCQQIRIQTPDSSDALPWLSSHNVKDAESLLRLFGNAPLKVLAAGGDSYRAQREQFFTSFRGIILGQASIAKAVDPLRDADAADYLPMLLGWTADIIKCRMGAHSQIIDLDRIDDYRQLAAELQHEHWFSIYDQLIELHRSDSASFKAQPMLESIFAAIRLLKTESAVP